MKEVRTVITGAKAESYHRVALEMLQSLTEEYEGDTADIINCLIDINATFILTCAQRDSLDMAADDFFSSIRQTIQARLHGSFQ